MYGNQMINDPGGIAEKESITLYKQCFYCKISHPENDLKEIFANQTPVNICPDCDKELKTCYFCGEKIMPNEHVSLVSGFDYHIDCI